jgi:NTP pyrophosphatase (non-canonical NTP hydrolase)
MLVSLWRYFIAINPKRILLPRLCCGFWSGRRRGRKMLRPELAWFAEEMEKQLKANDHKGGWQDCDICWLFRRMIEEAEELKREISNSKKYRTFPVYKERIVKEAADVANYAMMIADIAKTAFDGREKEVPHDQTTD